MIQRSEDIGPWFERGCRLFTYAADAILLMEPRAAPSRGFVRPCPGMPAADPVMRFGWGSP